MAVSRDGAFPGDGVDGGRGRRPPGETVHSRGNEDSLREDGLVGGDLTVGTVSRVEALATDTLALRTASTGMASAGTASGEGTATASASALARTALGVET